MPCIWCGGDTDGVDVCQSCCGEPQRDPEIDREAEAFWAEPIESDIRSEPPGRALAAARIYEEAA